MSGMYCEDHPGYSSDGIKEPGCDGCENAEETTANVEAEDGLTHLAWRYLGEAPAHVEGNLIFGSGSVFVATEPIKAGEVGTVAILSVDEEWCVACHRIHQRREHGVVCRTCAVLTWTYHGQCPVCREAGR